MSKGNHDMGSMAEAAVVASDIIGQIIEQLELCHKCTMQMVIAHLLGELCETMGERETELLHLLISDKMKQTARHKGKGAVH